jgi:predicted PolB exonuclease-like 3'-5' exonuclease
LNATATGPLMNILVFDIETIPDVETGRCLFELTELSDADVANKMWEMRRQETNGSDFLRHHLHRIIVISAVLHSGDKLKVWSLGDNTSTEADIIQRFFEGIEKYTPVLVSWNGCGFDLPVLHYRALLHGISAPRYWDVGEDDSNFRWNNYLNRYHYRHMDIMDILSCYQSRASAPLDQIATMLKLPGKMGMHGSKVWEAYQQGNIQTIRNYCETDVLNTYLVFMRFELLRGKITKLEYDQYCLNLRQLLQQLNQPHLNAFEQAWQIT